MARILLADKQLGFEDIFRDLLSHYGHEVKQVTTGAEALEEYPKYDLLITALFLKDTIGFQIIEEIRSQDPLFPILVHSGAVEEWLDKAVSLGANAALQKPVTIEVLIEQIESMLPGSAPMYH